MKTTVFAMCTAALLFIPVAHAEDAHHPSKAGTVGAAEAKTEMGQQGMDKHMGAMQEHMLKMHEQMHKIMDAKDAQERERLMQEHQKMMREHMQDMKGMMKGGMMGGSHKGGGAVKESKDDKEHKH